MKTKRIVIAQHDFIVGDIEGNTANIIALTQQAQVTHQADLVIFPELCITGYPPEDLLLRPSLYERVQTALEIIQQSIKDITIVVGFPTIRANAIFNSAAIINQQSIVKQYDKQHLPNYTVFDEKRYFTPGNSLCLFNWEGLQLGLVICEDLWFDEPAQSLANAGAQLLISINASPFDCNKATARRKLLEERAQKCNTPIIYANVVGGQDELVFDGGSMAVNADGKIAVSGKQFSSELIPVTITLNDNNSINITQQPLPAPLSEEATIYQALVLGVRDYIVKNGFSSALIGLSGGIDSALTLAIACDAIGNDHVTAILMPSQYTASMSLEDAAEEAERLGITYHTIAIEPMFQAYQQALGSLFSGLAIDKTEENLQARIRGMLLMALANKFSGIVLTTSNKSEMAVGYATLYGDMAGGFAVLKDIPKTMVYRLTRYRNSLTPVIPERVITRPPSAELAPDQTDQDTLPDYETLDAIIARYVGQDQDAKDIIAAGFDPAIVHKITVMIDRNEYKRRQAPPGIRISERAFGKDRRYPITSHYQK